MRARDGVTGPVVFLDIDGVLNDGGWWRLQKDKIRGPREDEATWRSMINPEGVARLNRITAATGARLVVSSSWRGPHNFERLCRILHDSGVAAPILGVTPHMAYRDREILQYVMREGVTAWIAIDDMSLPELRPEHVVMTSWDGGLLDEHVERAIALLERQSRK